MAILLVDDDRQMQALVSMFLTRYGFEVLTAGDAIETLHVLARHTPEMFILDIMMPGINGVELCRVLRARPDCGRTPIIIMSSLSDPFTRENCLHAGANAFLNKYELPSLPELVKKTFGTGSCVRFRAGNTNCATIHDGTVLMVVDINFFTDLFN